MSSFAAAFRDLVMPDLRRSCRLQALSMARDRCDFSEATDAVLAQAQRRGATHLPDGLISELIDWIDATLLRTVAEIETKPDAAREIVDEALRPLEAAWRMTP